MWPAGLLLLIWLHGRSGRFAFTASCSGWSREALLSAREANVS